MGSLWRWVIFLLGMAVLLLVGLLLTGEVLVQARHRALGLPPQDLQALTVNLPLTQGGRMAGWMVPGHTGAGVVLLLHGVRADRRAMLGRARFLKQLGYGVLLVDLPAHGESSGDYITFGVEEAQGVKAALAYLQGHWPGERIGVVGVSLGAAAFVLSGADAHIGAVVLESMYPTIEEAIRNRLRIHLGEWGTHFAPLLIAQLSLRWGLSSEQLHPVNKIARVPCPCLVISGAVDRHTLLSETLRIFHAAPEPKALWVLEGAGHIDLHAFAPAAYEDRVGGFLGTHLPRNLRHDEGHWVRAGKANLMQ